MKNDDFIADVMGSFKLKLQERLANVKENVAWDDWHDGVKFGREDMLEEIIEMIDKGYLNCLQHRLCVIKLNNNGENNIKI